MSKSSSFQRKNKNDKKRNKNHESFMKFVPSDIRYIVQNLTEREKSQMMDFLGKLITSKATYCGHCDKLIQCDGPCEFNIIRGSCNCGSLCYHCYKGDNWDAPCPLSATGDDITSYWKTHYKNWNI